MSHRTLARCAVTLAALAGPTTAAAMPSDPVETGSSGSSGAVVVAPAPVYADDGLGVFGIAGIAGAGLLLVGAGFGTGRVVQRRHALPH